PPDNRLLLPCSHYLIASGFHRACRRQALDQVPQEPDDAAGLARLRLIFLGQKSLPRAFEVPAKPTAILTRLRLVPGTIEVGEVAAELTVALAQHQQLMGQRGGITLTSCHRDLR